MLRKAIILLCSLLVFLQLGRLYGVTQLIKTLNGISPGNKVITLWYFSIPLYIAFILLSASVIYGITKGKIEGKYAHLSIFSFCLLGTLFMELHLWYAGYIPMFNLGM